MRGRGREGRGEKVKRERLCRGWGRRGAGMLIGGGGRSAILQVSLPSVALNDAGTGGQGVAVGPL